MSTSVKPIRIDYLPSKGVNLYLDQDALNQEVAYICENFIIDKATMRLRPGLSKTSYTSDSGVEVYQGIKAYFDDDTIDDATIVRLVGSFKYYKSNAYGADISLPINAEVSSTESDAQNGTFIQYRNDVYYSDPGTDPIRITKNYDDVTADIKVNNATAKVGVESPSPVTVLHWCDNVTAPTSVTGTATTNPSDTSVILDVDKSHAMYRGGGAKISTSSLTLRTAAFKVPDAAVGSMDLTHHKGGSSWDSSSEDFIAFYLYRWEKRNIESIVLQLIDGYGSPRTAELILVNSVIEELQGVPTHSFNAQWHADRDDYKLFYVKVAKHWFEAESGFDWTDIEYFALAINSAETYSGSGVSRGEATVTLNYLHMVGAPPTPGKAGLIADFEGGEAWTNNGSDLDTNVFRDSTYNTTGAFSLGIKTGQTAQYTPSSVIDIYNWGNGNTLTARDKIAVDLALVATGTSAATVAACKITLKLYDTRAHATNNYLQTVFHLSDSLITSKVDFKTRRHPLQTYSVTWAGTMALASLAYIGKIEVITATPGAGTATLYVDNLRVERGSYIKTIASFTPGVRDFLAADAIGSVAEAVMQTILPKREWAENLAGATNDAIQNLDFLNHWGKYRTLGNGSFVMPWNPNSKLIDYMYENTELKDVFAGDGLAEGARGSMSSLLISAGGDPESNMSGAVSAFQDDLEGFRVGLPFPKYLGATGFTDFSNYWTWSKLDGTNNVSMAIEDDDYCRCWTYISDPDALSKIIFRIYVTDDTTSPVDANWNNFNIKHSTATAGHTPEYFEYTYDAGMLPNAEALAAQAAYMGQKEQGDPLDKFLQVADEVLTQYDTKAPGSPEFIIDMVKAYNDPQHKFDNLGTAGEVTGKNGKYYGLVHVMKWRVRDFVFKGSDVSHASWTSVTGISMEVVPKPGCTVDVAFDNWYFYTAGSLSGTYQYCSTFVDSAGMESLPSLPSDSYTAKREDVILSNLPSVWPDGVQHINLYRIGGDSAIWRLLGTVSREAQIYEDTTPDYLLKQPMPESGYPPPKCSTMALIDNRMFYGDVTDRFGIARSSRVQISEPYFPGKCLDTMIRDLSPNDGTKITRIIDFNGYPVILKERSIWTLDDLQYVPRRRHPTIGCIAKNSVAVGENFVIFLSYEGIVIFTISDVSLSAGKVVKRRFDDLRVYDKAEGTTLGMAGLSSAVGFIHDDYYFLFYQGLVDPRTPKDTTLQTTNDSCMILHIGTGVWTEANFTLTSGVNAAFPDPSAADKTFIIDNKAILDFWEGDKDLAVGIAGTYQTGQLDFGLAATRKTLKALYVRALNEDNTTAATYTITPMIEGTNVVNPTGTDITFGRTTVGTTPTTVGTNVLTTTATTQAHVSRSGVTGYTHTLKITTTGKTIISNITGLYDEEPPLSR